MTVQALKLVHSSTTQGREASDAQQVFDHWVWMLGKNPNRVAFGPTRRKAVDKALELYALDMLLMAVEGCASHPHNRGDNDRGEEYTDLCLILRNEGQVERFARRGEKLRASAARAIEREAAAVNAPAPSPVDPAATAAQRERVRLLASQLAGRAHG